MPETLDTSHQAPGIARRAGRTHATLGSAMHWPYYIGLRVPVKGVSPAARGDLVMIGRVHFARFRRIVAGHSPRRHQAPVQEPSVPPLRRS
jgi:hypothetical protein